MKPTIGRIVIYREDEKSESPAIVVNVRVDGSLDLNIFRNEVMDIPGIGTVARVAYDGNVIEGTEPGTWHWPPRV